MEMYLKEINEKHIGKIVNINAKIKGLRQTNSGFLYEIEDKTGKIFAKSNKSLMIGSILRANYMVEKQQGKIILNIKDLQHEFLIKSKNLEKLRPVFEKADFEIKKAIKEKRQIIIRHHDDIDGYVSGIALEKAIKSLIKQEKTHYYLVRNSNRTPYYNYTDALRDLNNYLARKKYDNKTPLIILCDLGSNNQSIRSIKRTNFDYIIIDHHRYDENNKKSVKVFLNPIAYGLSSDLNAGALCCELAVMLNPQLELKHLPALSGIADKSKGDDFEKCVKLSGSKKDFLINWALFIDHELYYCRFMESPEFLDELFFNKDFSVKDIEEELKKIEVAAKKYAKVKKFKKFKLIQIDKSKTGVFGDYASSKLTRITHDLYSGSRITMAEYSDSISFRADEVRFSVLKLIEILKKKLPYGLISGGGHDCAGNIKFNAGSKEEINELIFEYLNEIDKI